MQLIQHVDSATRRRHWPTVAALVLMLTLGSAGAIDQSPPVVAAAASLQSAMRALADAFTETGGGQLRLAFGASGNLYRQIRQGAPFQAFFSADENYVDRLVPTGLIEGSGQVYARGRLALIMPDDSPLKSDPTLADLAAALEDGRLTRFAIANPVHAPYGERARDVLIAAGLWDRIQARLVMGENVAQAAQFAVNGATQGGLVANGLVSAVARQRAVRSASIPADRHRPLRQKAAVRRDAGPAARAFLEFVLSPAGQTILAAQGFEPVGPTGQP